jgi:uncharacterized protein
LDSFKDSGGGVAISEVSSGLVKGYLHTPADSNGIAFVLAHGAGSDANAPLLVRLAEALEQQKYAVLRVTLPFKQDGKPPLPANAVKDRAGLAEAAQFMKKDFAHVFMGGHSYGGRQASMLAAEQGGTAERLLLLSYPLHPPDKPAQLRTDHFPNLRTPAVFVQGTKDPFGTVDEVKTALELIPVKPDFIAIEGAGHDLRIGKFKFAAIVVDYFARNANMH